MGTFFSMSMRENSIVDSIDCIGNHEDNPDTCKSDDEVSSDCDTQKINRDFDNGNNDILDRDYHSDSSTEKMKQSSDESYSEDNDKKGDSESKKVKGE